jgi:hypothetical protein
LRELRIGEDVLARDGSRLGEVERIVVDEAAHRVTHLVVAGRLVPIAGLRDAGPDGLAADLDQAGLRALPGADALGGPGSHWEAPPGWALESFLAVTGALVGQAPYQPPVHVDLGGEEPREVTPGSPVWSGSRRLGEVSHVLTDDAGVITGIVLRHGLLPHEVVVPPERVREVVGNNVHVDLDEASLESLEPYRGRQLRSP